jgi:putative transposase
MNKPIHSVALFRLSVLGPLASRDQLERGELNAILKELSSRSYNIPHSRRTHLSEKTIARWYYAWLRGGIDALVPQVRSDRGKTRIKPDVQSTLLQLKQDNPARSLNTLITLLEAKGLVAQGELSRASLHRFLCQHGLSKRTLADAPTIERRRFVAQHASDIWYGDVMHGPSISTRQGKRKVYLVTLMDDASRLIAHSAFCLGETALDIESVLKQALLKRGLPRKLMIDNGAAYRADSLQGICARFDIRLIYCRPYEPESKGKLERWHRTFREQFLTELALEKISSLDDLNARLWAWIEQVYHQRPHSYLENHITPVQRWRQDLVHIKPLGTTATHIDEYFYHRAQRKVKKDGTLSWAGRSFEVAYELVGQKAILVIDPHTDTPLYVESLKNEFLCKVHPVDPIANNHRKRQRPTPVQAKHTPQEDPLNVVEIAYEEYQRSCLLTDSKAKEDQ